MENAALEQIEFSVIMIIKKEQCKMIVEFKDNV